MKLKTLKDFEGKGRAMGKTTIDYDPLFWVNTQVLREEAIKRVKYWEKEMKEAKTEYYCELVGAIREFMSFFNITEEELK